MFKRLLSADLKFWHLLLVVGLLAVGTTGSTSAQTATRTAADLSPRFPAGSFHMGAAASNTSQTVHAADGYVEVLRVGFSVPSGQKADIVASFNAEAYKYTNGYCYLEFHLDTLGSPAMPPGELWVADGYVYTGAYPTISAQGFMSNVGAGKHSVIVAILATGGDCFVDDRSVTLISNRH